MVLVTFGTIRYATFVKDKRRLEAERLAREAEELRHYDGKRDHSTAPDAAVILAAN
jgi:hypothetical protein